MSDDYQRHGDLIDKMFLFGLTQEEAQELEQIRDRLDDLEEIWWYGPIIRRLEKLYPACGSIPVPAPASDAKGDG